jgi:protein-S-isoprenylcysteine O-methyltransferase Ste14
MNSSLSAVERVASTRLRLFSRRLLSNYASTLFFIGLCYWVVTDVSEFHRSMLQGEWVLSGPGFNATITVHAVFVSLIALYAVLLLPYYAAYPWMHANTYTFLQGLWFAWLRGRRRNAASPSESSGGVTLASPFSRIGKQAGLALLLKFFFAPLMINWCLLHIANLTGSLLQFVHAMESGMSGRALFDSSLFWSCFQLILFVDTLLFTLGYMIEVPALGNRIRSIEPTFFGWFICLACYPPFNDTTQRLFAWESSDFPFFESNFVHLTVNVALLTSLAIFSWASISLGFKASNLTNRGIVARGPYRLVRHPAYAAKNLAWWLGALPTLLMFFAAGAWRSLAYALFSLCGWTAIYALRALTEERHLLMLRNGYAEYAGKVKWRFVPGLW